MAAQPGARFCGAQFLGALFSDGARPSSPQRALKLEVKTDSLVHEHERRESRRESRREARRQSAIAVEQKATDLQILMEAAQRQLVEVHGETPEAAAAAARPPLVTEGTTALQLLMADAARKLEQAGGGTWRQSRRWRLAL